MTCDSLNTPPANTPPVDPTEPAPPLEDGMRVDREPGTATVEQAVAPSPPTADAAPRSDRWKVWACFVAISCVLSGLNLALTWNGRWAVASADGLFAEHPDKVWAWAWRSAVAELAWWWWIAAVSGTIGSFLNVVVYRLPRGVSLARTGSRCVHCQTPIKWYDNQPVIGWFLVGGRCRACRQPISFRYPLIEVLAILLGLTMFGLTVQTSFIVMPGSAAPIADSRGWHYWLLDPAPAQQLVLYFYLLPGLFACLSIAVASVDRERLPARFYWTVATIVLGGPLLYYQFVGPWLTTRLGDLRWQEAATTLPLLTGVPGWFHELFPRRLAGVDWQWLTSGLAGLILGGSSGWLCGLGARWAAARLGCDPSHPVLYQAPSIFWLFGLTGGWPLPWVVLGLWLVESAARGLGRGRRLPPTWALPAAIWIALPVHYLLALLLWRWTA
jgi:prepilin signal peptidase PulO-like enzyme (type II secretory pathway)